MNSALPRRTRWAVAAFVVVAVELLCINLFITARNQIRFDAGDKPHVQSRNIVTVAANNRYFVVKYVFSLYHRLRLLKDKTLVIPPDLEGHRWFFERVSRIHLEAGERLEMPLPLLQRLHKDSVYVGSFDGENTSLTIVLDDRESRYVVAAAPWGGGPLIILPESRYRAEMAAQQASASAGADQDVSAAPSK